MIKELEYLPMTQIPVGAQKEALHEIYEATEQCELVKTEMARAYNPWRTAYLTMVARYETPAGNVDITKPIHQLDSQRDSVLFAIEVTTRAALKSIDPAMVAAAEAVDQTRVSFPVNPNTGYLAQTSQLDDYLAAMLGPQLENVTKINALPLVQNLKELNDQVHALVNDRDLERAEQENELYRSVARQQAIDAWLFLRKFVNGYSIVVVDPAHPNTQLNNYIDLINVKMRRYRDIYIGAPAKPGAGEAGVGDGEGSEGGNTGGSDSEGGSGSGSTGSDSGSTGSGSGTGSTTPTLHTITFQFNNGTQTTQQYAAGATITPPTNTAGYVWKDLPSVMPAQDITVTEEEDPNMPPPGSGGSGFE